MGNRKKYDTKFFINNAIIVNVYDCLLNYDMHE